MFLLLKKRKHTIIGQSLSTVLKCRSDDKQTILYRVVIPTGHPTKVAPSIAITSIPKTSDLVSNALARFNNKEQNAVPGTNSSQVDNSVEHP